VKGPSSRGNTMMSAPCSTWADHRRLVARWSRHLAPNSVRRNYAVLRAIVNAAVDADLIARSPCRSVKLPTPEPAGHRILDSVELRRLAEAVPVDYRAMVYLAGVIRTAQHRLGRSDPRLLLNTRT
jgi:hypothetical protein